MLLTAAQINMMLVNDCYKCYVGVMPLVLNGLGNSLLISSIWGAISIVIPIEVSGIAIGIVHTISNSGLAIAPLIIGLIVDKTYYY